MQYVCCIYSLFLSFPGARVSEPFGERIVVDFQLGDLWKNKTSFGVVLSRSLHPRGETKRTNTWGTHDGYAPFRFGRPSRRWTRFLWTRTCGKSSTAVWWCRWLGLDGNGAGTCASSSIWSRVAKKKSEKDGEREEGEKQKKKKKPLIQRTIFIVLATGSDGGQGEGAPVWYTVVVGPSAPDVMRLGVSSPGTGAVIGPGDKRPFELLTLSPFPIPWTAESADTRQNAECRIRRKMSSLFVPPLLPPSAKNGRYTTKRDVYDGLSTRLLSSYSIRYYEWIAHHSGVRASGRLIKTRHL